MQSGGDTDVFDLRSTPKMELTGSSDTLETFYETTRRHMPEDDNIQIHGRKKVKSLSIRKAAVLYRVDTKVYQSGREELRPYMGVAAPGAVPTLLPSFPCRSTDWLLLWVVGVPWRAGVEWDAGLERSDVGVRL